MAGVSDSRLRKAGPWPRGVDNLSPEGDLVLNEFGSRPAAVREADNIDFTKEGRARRRRGYAEVHETELAHSLWSHPEIGFGLFVDNGSLFYFGADESVQDLGIEVGQQPLSFDLFGDKVFYSSRTNSGMLTLDLQAWSWGPECPVGQPALEAVDGFGLPPGQYQVAVTFVDHLGRESGTPRAAVVQVAQGQGILLTDIPQPADAAIIYVYVSDADDNVLRRAVGMAPGSTSYTIVTQATQASVKLETQFLVPMPAGHIVCRHNGRQWVADGHILRWSPALRYGLTNPAEAAIRFDAPIDLVEPVGAGTGSAGLFVAAGSATYYFAGRDPSDFERRRVSSSGAVPRSACSVPGNFLGFDSEDEVTVWLSRSGYFVMGLDGGKVQPLKQGAVVDDADSAASLFIQRGGINQVVTALRGPRSQGLAVSDKAVAHVVHTPIL